MLLAGFERRSDGAEEMPGGERIVPSCQPRDLDCRGGDRDETDQTDAAEEKGAGDSVASGIESKKTRWTETGHGGFIAGEALC